MNNHYDEDIQDNVFFQEITNNHKDLIEKVSNENWIICIPRSGTLPSNAIDVADILDHILVLNTQEPSSHYYTVSKKEVRINEHLIFPKNEDLCNGQIEILFKETFHNKNGSKYTVWCIDRPLNHKFCCTDSNLNSLCNLVDCVDFLWSETFGDDVVEQICHLSEKFLFRNKNLYTNDLQTQKDLVGSLYSHCLQVALKNCYIRDKINVNQNYLEDVKLAVEACMQNCLNDKLFMSVCSSVCQDDSEFNKCVQNYTFHQNHIDINTEGIFAAKCELNKVNRYFTVLGKINCLKNAFSILSKSSSIDCNITTDYLLQAFIYIITNLQLNNWIGNLVFIKEFHFSSLDISDESNFLITTLEAAIQHIKSDFCTSSHSSKDSTVDIVQMEEMSELERSIKYKTVEIKLCHPLCTCPNCENVVQNCKELNGYSLLHVATIYDKSSVVEYLLENNHYDVNISDAQGETALHWAAKKGFQNILLLLIQAKAEVNIKNYDGNTALHLAVNNGHENCVKALLYCSKHANVNCTNKWQHTPLHLASKWGYRNIVEVLLQCGASTKSLNKFRQKPSDLAQNLFILELLQAEIPKLKKHVSFQEPQVFEFESTHPRCNKKVDLLLKAVESNDLPLTCYHLGIPCPTTQNNTSSKCHPLCACDKCKSDDSDTEQSNTVEVRSFEPLNVNVSNSEGYTALHVAAKFGRVEILRLLLDAGALPNILTSKCLYTPLHLACMYQKVAVVRELLKCGGCKVDVQDLRGNTPLFYACLKNAVRIFELLLAHGADINIRNKNNVTVWHEAERKQLSGILKLLNGNKVLDLVDDSDSDIFD